MNVRRLTQRFATVATVAVAAMAMNATAARAAATVYHGDDFAFTIGADGKTVWVCDKERDGNGVYAEYYTRGGRFDSINDGNGSQDGCGFENTADGTFVDRLRVCEHTQGCSGWKDS